jgi:HEAT repeat protein
METAEIEALFARTLTGDYEADDAWDAIHALRLNGSPEIFERAAEWCSSEDPLKRARAAAVLCQLRRGVLTDQPPLHERVFRDESYALVTKMLQTECESIVLDSGISALGHLDNPAAIPLILTYQDHPDRDVRFAVAFALGCFPNDPESVTGLVKLTEDPDSHVRDWAVFGLGVQGDADSPEIRKALLRCLKDDDKDVREEAAVGLGKRRDQRLIPELMTMLDEPEFTIRVAEAASAVLGLDKDPHEWTGEDYKSALIKKFAL